MKILRVRACVVLWLDSSTVSSSLFSLDFDWRLGVVYYIVLYIRCGGGNGSKGDFQPHTDTRDVLAQGVIHFRVPDRRRPRGAFGVNERVHYFRSRNYNIIVYSPS